MNTQNNGAEAPQDFSSQAEFEAWREGKTLDNATNNVQDKGADRLNAGETNGKSALPTSATDGQQSDEVELDGEGNPTPKHKGGVQTRIDQLTRKLNDLAADREHWRNQVLLRQQQELQQANQGQQQQKAPEVDPTKPKLEDFDTTEAYTEALTDWKLEKHQEAQKREVYENRVREEGRKIHESWMTKVEAAKARYEDFDSVGEQLRNIQVPLHLQQVLALSDVGPDVLYTVMKDPELIEKIANSSNLKQVMILGQVEAAVIQKLAGAQQTETQTVVSRAPAPITPAKGSNSKVEKSYDELSFSEFEARREEEIRKSRKR